MPLTAHCVSIVLCIIFVFSLSACSSSSTPEDPKPKEVRSETSQAEEPEVSALAASHATFELPSEFSPPDPNASNQCKEGRRLLEESLRSLRDVFAITIDDANQKQLQQKLEQKMKLAEQAQYHLEKVLETRCPRPATAAIYLMGLQYAHFAETIMDAPVPSKMSEEQKRTYCGLLFDRAQSVYQKSQAAWKQTVGVGQDFGEDNRWTRKAAEYLEAGGLDRETEVSACAR